MEGLHRCRLITLLSDALDTLDLLVGRLRVDSLVLFDRRHLSLVAVHPDDDTLLLLNLALELEGALVNLVCLVAVLQGSDRAAQPIDLFDVV